MGARSTKHHTEVKSITDVPSTRHDMEVKSITDLPNEIIQKFIMVHLASTDVHSFSMTGVKRFKQIAEDELEKRRE